MTRRRSGEIQSDAGKKSGKDSTRETRKHPERQTTGDLQKHSSLEAKCRQKISGHDKAGSTEKRDKIEKGKCGTDRLQAMEMKKNVEKAKYMKVPENRQIESKVMEKTIGRQTDKAESDIEKRKKLESDGRHFSKNERKVKEKEAKIDAYLIENGHDVSPNPDEGKPGTGRQGDRIVDGIKTEYKTLEEGATPKTIENSVKKSIRGEGQARDIIIDARDSGLTKAETGKGINDAMRRSQDKIDNIRIIGDGFDMSKSRKQSNHGDSPETR